MRLREVINNLQEEAWTSHKELSNILYKHTGNKQLAIDFYHLESEFDSQDDMQHTGLSALDIDPFEADRERVNRILSINRVPVKVLKMKHNDAYETVYSLLQSAPVPESRENLDEIKAYGYGLEGKPPWYDRAVALKKANPHITATEIGKQVGATYPTIVYWLTGYSSNNPFWERPHTKDWPPFKHSDFTKGKPTKYTDGRKPNWYDQALQMAKAGETFASIGKKFGVSDKNIGSWLVKGRKTTRGKIINPDAELEPRNIIGKKLDVNMLMDFISTGYTDEDIIELIVDEKGPKIASQVKNMLPILRKKQNPGTQVIDKTATGINNPDISSVKG